MLSHSHLRGRASSAPASTRAPLTAANLQAAGSQRAPRGTSQAPSEMSRGRRRRRAISVSEDADTETLRLASDQESADYKTPRGASWHVNPVPRFNPAANTNTQRDTAGAGSLFRQGSTDGGNHAQLAAYTLTRYPFTNQAAIKAQQLQQCSHLASALGPIMGGSPEEAYALATQLQSHFQGSVTQSALPPIDVQTGIPVSVIFRIEAPPQLVDFLQKSINGAFTLSPDAFAPSRGPGPSLIPVGPSLIPIHTSPGSVVSGETGFPATRLQADVQKEPSQSEFKNKLRAFRDKFTRSQAPAATALSQNASRYPNPELREQFSRFLSAQGNAQRGAPSHTPGSQFTLSGLGPAGQSLGNSFPAAKGAASQSHLENWVQEQLSNVPQPSQGNVPCAREYHGPQESIGGIHQPHYGSVF